jgi:hypothetical protein
MKRQKEEDVSVAEVKAAVEPESSAVQSVSVQGKSVTIIPLKRAWGSLFLQAALPMFTAELSAPETILKSLADGSFSYTPTAKLLVDSEMESDKYLDRAAAVVLASKEIGAEKDPEKFIKEQESWVKDNCYTDELRVLVRAQGEKERLAARVGERLPARFASLLSLAGVPITEDSLKQLLTNFLQKLQAPAGSGS